MQGLIFGILRYVKNQMEIVFISRGDRGVTISRFLYPVLPPPALYCKTDETLTRLTQSTHMYICHAISFMSYDVSDLERFPISQEVMPFFFYPEHEFSFFDLSRV